MTALPSNPFQWPDWINTRNVCEKVSVQSQPKAKAFSEGGTGAPFCEGAPVIVLIMLQYQLYMRAYAAEASIIKCYSCQSQLHGSTKYLSWRGKAVAVAARYRLSYQICSCLISCAAVTNQETHFVQRCLRNVQNKVQWSFVRGSINSSFFEGQEAEKAISENWWFHTEKKSLFTCVMYLMRAAPIKGNVNLLQKYFRSFSLHEHSLFTYVSKAFWLNLCDFHMAR